MISFARVSKHIGFWDRVKMAWSILIKAQFANEVVEVAGFSDEDIGAAARVVHSGCRKAFGQFFMIAPAAQGNEGGPITVPSGFDAQRIRLTGNVSGQPPFKGTLKHHGWIAAEVRMPSISEALDPRIIAPAEVELS